MNEAAPDAICWIEELIDIKLPRILGSTVDVTIANAGTILPETMIINIVVINKTTGSDVLPKLAMIVTGMTERVARTVYTWCLPYLSERCPIKRLEKNVKNPPKK